MTLIVGKNSEILNIEEMKKNPLKRLFKHKVAVFKNSFKDIISISEMASERKITGVAMWSKDKKFIIHDLLENHLDVDIQEVIGLESDLVRARGEMTFAQNKLDKQESEQRKENLKLQSEVNRMKTIMLYCASEIEKGADTDLILAILKQARDEYD
tara:strand:+ start:505 stop:972 length:468 start_codon:yes stop_codon:yes gene_type:complete